MPSNSEQKMNFAASTGVTVSPGKVLGREERRRRKDSAINNMDGITEEQPDDSNMAFSTLWQKIYRAIERPTRPFFTELDQRTEQHFAPEAAARAATQARNGRYPYNARAFICFLIAVLLVFGAAYTLVEYLLFATRASAACSAVTSYIPYTVTETVTYTPSSSSSDPAASDGTSISYTTLRTTSTLLNTVTVMPGSSTPPPSAQTTITTTQIVSPVSTLPDASTSTVTIQSTEHQTQTVTVPPFTLTTYSFMPSTQTTTSTSTLYTTLSVLQASSARSSYGGMNPAGWNTSSTLSQSVATLTGTYYLGTGSLTTSTGTTMITTTVVFTGQTTAMSLSTSFAQPPSSDGANAAPTATPAGSSVISSASTSSLSTTMTSLASIGLPSSVSTAPGIFSNASSTDTSTASSSSFPTSPILSTGAPSVSSTSSSSSSMPVSANSSSNGLAGTASTTFSSSSASTPSTTAAMVVPITSTLSSGELTTMLETTTTTMGLIGSMTTTVSGYFVYNGTTLLPYTSGSATAASLTPSSSSVANALSGSTSTTTLLTTSTPSSHSTRGPSVSIPVNASAPALSALSSEISLLTGSALSSLSPTSFSVSSVAISSASSSASSLAPASVAAPTLAATSATSVSAPSSSTSSTSSTTGLSSSSLSTSSSSSTSSTPSTLMTTTSSTSSSASHPPPPSSLQSYSSSSAMSVTSTSASSVTSSTATATPTDCGEHGNFTLNFDTLPNFIPSNQNQTDITQAPPIPRPYHHLTFSDGYVYAPQPSEPYTPSSSPKLAVFLANGTGAKTSSMPPGEIGDGPYESMSAFWFDAFSGMFGCNDAGPDPCTLVLTGYTYSQGAKDEVPTYSQNVTIPPCAAQKGCQLQPVDFPASFRDLSGLQVQAFVDNQPRMFFMDDLALGWSNSTCDAGLQRQKYQ